MAGTPRHRQASPIGYRTGPGQPQENVAMIQRLEKTNAALGQKPLRTFRAAGLSASTFAAFESMVGILSLRSKCEWEASDAGPVDLLIVGSGEGASDMDVAGCRHVARLRSDDDATFGDVFWLDHPFRVFQVLSLLNEIEQLDPGLEQQQQPRRHRNDSWSLYDVLNGMATRTRRGCWLRMSYGDAGHLFVSDDLGHYACDEGGWAKLAVGLLPSGDMSPCAVPAAELVRGTGRELLWRVGLLSGRGCLGNGVAADTAYHLTAWPNFGKFRATPLQLRLSAMLATTPSSFEQIMGRVPAGTNPDDVRRYINACSLLGLLQHERSPEAVVADRPAPTGKGYFRGVLAKIRNQLGLSASPTLTAP